MWQCVVLSLVFLASAGLCRNLQADDDTAWLKIVDLEQLTSTDNTRIIGGSPARIENYNFTVQLLRSNRLACGGTLLTFKTVLTSAHCFFDDNGNRIRDSEFSVRAGSTFLNSGGTVIPVARAILHPRYNTPPRDNDIAVVVLQRNFTRRAAIDTAAIPAQGNHVPDNQAVVHVGWGVTDLMFPAVSNELQQVQVYTINRGVCRNNYGFLQMDVSNNMICAGMLGVGGRDACQGDSGGPLIWRGAVVGVTSWGYGCAHPDFPGISAYVPQYTDWIVSTVRANGAMGTAPSIASAILVVASFISALLNK